MCLNDNIDWENYLRLIKYCDEYFNVDGKESEN